MNLKFFLGGVVYVLLSGLGGYTIGVLSVMVSYHLTALFQLPFLFWPVFISSAILSAPFLVLWQVFLIRMWRWLRGDDP